MARAGKLEPKERESFERAHKEKIELMYTKLEEKQQFEMKQLEEKINNKLFRRERDQLHSRERYDCTVILLLDQCKNILKSMSHLHRMCLVPLFVYQDSASPTYQ